MRAPLGLTVGLFASPVVCLLRQRTTRRLMLPPQGYKRVSKK